MLSTFQIFQLSKSTITTAPFYASLGRCTDPLGQWFPVWCDGGKAEDGYIPAVGDKLFTDQNLTQPLTTGYHRLAIESGIQPNGNFTIPPQVPPLGDLTVFNSEYRLMFVGTGEIQAINTCSVLGNTDLGITHTIPIYSGGSYQGAVELINGEPNEVIDITYELFLPINTPFQSISFTGPFSTGPLNNQTLSQSKQITLDANGTAQGNFTIQTSSQQSQIVSCIITIVNRSSSEPMPSNDFTNISA